MMKKEIGIVFFAVLLFLSGCQKTRTEHLQDTDFAMGTVINQNIYGNQPEDTAAAVLEKIKALENTISWRIESSPIAQINQSAGTGQAVSVDRQLEEWLSACKEVYEKSDGALDITVGPVSRLWDIGGDNPKVASKEEIDAVLPLVDETALHVSDGKVTFD
ncbi:MAG: FAD:protein FMN transferase, partial [Lachnospiraceae bacterium]|nr:FAD:protein FMN transferase [Lachnospiraceae bacterium]